MRISLGVLATVTWLRRLGGLLTWHIIKRGAATGSPFVNDARDYLFFMDGNVNVKKLINKVGLGLMVIQQTYVLPLDSACHFLEQAAALLHEKNVTSTLLDILYMPMDDITMSASHGLDGFTCTFVFEDIRAIEE